MKAKGIYILIIVVLAAAAAQAEKLGMTDRLSGTYVVSFNTQYGDVKVFLPDDMSGGDTVSASIFAYPVGANSPSVLNGYKIHTDVQSASVQSGRITINIPRNMSGSSLRVTLRDASNRELSHSSAVVKLPDSFADRADTPTAFDFETPLIGQSGRLIEIKGPFDGDFTTTKLTIGGKPAHVISESPRKLVFEAPADLSGSAEIVLVENGVVVKRPFTSLRVVKIGEESSSSTSGVVPKGYSAQAPEAVVSVESKQTEQVTEEIVSSEIASPAPGIIEEPLDLETGTIQEEVVVETYTQPANGSANAQIALLLDEQLNATLMGAPKLIKAEKIDTVVMRELTTTEEVEDGSELIVKSQEDDVIEEDILVIEKKEVSPVEKSAKTRGDASYSSKELIERIYESTREDWDKSPPEVSGRAVTDKKKEGESIREGEIPAGPAADTSYSDKGKYTVQVASFKDPGAAKSFAQKLERKGYKVRVTETDIAGKGRWSRVSVGNFPTKQQAKEYGDWLKRREPGVKSVFITVIN